MNPQIIQKLIGISTQKGIHEIAKGKINYAYGMDLSINNYYITI